MLYQAPFAQASTKIIELGVFRKRAWKSSFFIEYFDIDTLAFAYPLQIPNTLRKMNESISDGQFMMHQQGCGITSYLPNKN